MADIERIDVDEARRLVTSGQASLVCAYEDEAKCSRMRLEGSIPITRLEPEALRKDRELIFYCA